MLLLLLVHEHGNTTTYIGNYGGDSELVVIPQSRIPRPAHIKPIVSKNFIVPLLNAICSFIEKAAGNCGKSSMKAALEKPGAVWNIAPESYLIAPYGNDLTARKVSSFKFAAPESEKSAFDFDK